MSDCVHRHNVNERICRRRGNRERAMEKPGRHRSILLGSSMITITKMNVATAAGIHSGSNPDPDSHYPGSGPPLPNRGDAYIRATGPTPARMPFAGTDWRGSQFPMDAAPTGPGPHRAPITVRLPCPGVRVFTNSNARRAPLQNLLLRGPERASGDRLALVSLRQYLRNSSLRACLQASPGSEFVFSGNDLSILSVQETMSTKSQAVEDIPSSRHFSLVFRAGGRPKGFEPTPSPSGTADKPLSWSMRFLPARRRIHSPHPVGRLPGQCRPGHRIQLSFYKNFLSFTYSDSSYSCTCRTFMCFSVISHYGRH